MYYLHTLLLSLKLVPPHLSHNLKISSQQKLRFHIVVNYFYFSCLLHYFVCPIFLYHENERLLFCVLSFAISGAMITDDLKTIPVFQTHVHF